MSAEIKEQTAPAWLQPPAEVSEKQILKQYAEEIELAHRTEQVDQHHLAISQGMRRVLLSLGVITDMENSEIVQKAMKKAVIHRRVFGGPKA